MNLEFYLCCAIMKKYLLLIPVFLCIQAFGQTGTYDTSKVPPPPDYANPKSWCALPFRADLCDFTSSYDPYVSDSDKLVDVFFIHPTTFMKGEIWNATIPDITCDKNTDEKPIKYQASVFNEACRIYAPRYRQAIIKSFYDTLNGSKSLSLAYSDVREAFLYYLKYYNNGRPFIIASHSQGTFHAKRLLAEFIDDKPLAEKMVIAYLIGYPVAKNMYKKIPVCSDTTMTNGIVCWYSFRHDFIPEGMHSFYDNSIIVNPISWSTDTMETDFSASKGAKGTKLNSRIMNRIKARIYENILWVTIKYPIIKKKKNLHAFDYNLFWYDMKIDIQRRISYFLKR